MRIDGWGKGQHTPCKFQQRLRGMLKVFGNYASVHITHDRGTQDMPASRRLLPRPCRASHVLHSQRDGPLTH